jgi:hypothetical protein
MLVWKGWGILGIIIPAALIFLTDAALGAAFGAGYNRGMVVPGSLCFSSVLVWLIGRQLNAKPPRILTDTETGETVEIKPQHSIFWIPLHWFALPLLALGLVFFARVLRLF